MQLLKSKAAIVATIALIAHAVFAMAVNREEHPPVPEPLVEFPKTVADWHMTGEQQIEEEIQAVLLASDTLLRSYDNAEGRTARLFIAYFASQRTGVNPHSPKHCLPGTGWIPTETSVLSVNVPGRDQPIPVNRYRVSRGASQSVVLYWYQGRGRYVASEYTARVYLIADAIRMNRTDTALVRVEIPADEGDAGAEAATQRGIDFIQKSFPSLDRFLPI